jgi:hypothetical protein
MRERGAARKQQGQQCQGYRSHPLSTNEATPCIASANANTNAARALSDPMKADVRPAAAVSGRPADRQDTRPANPAAAAPINEAAAENRASRWQSR